MARRGHQKGGGASEAPWTAWRGIEAENPECRAGHHAGAPHTHLSLLQIHPSVPTRRPTPWAPQNKPKRDLNIFQNVSVSCQSPRGFARLSLKKEEARERLLPLSAPHQARRQ